jgi:hypothetical protein
MHKATGKFVRGHQILIMEYLHDAVSKNMRAKLKLANAQK